MPQNVLRTARLLQGQIVKVAIVAICILVCRRHYPEDALLAKWLAPGVSHDPVVMSRAYPSSPGGQLQCPDCSVQEQRHMKQTWTKYTTDQYSTPFSLPQPMTDTMWLIVGYSFRCVKMPPAARQRHNRPSVKPVATRTSVSSACQSQFAATSSRKQARAI
jgi:hypothetical protein